MSLVATEKQYYIQQMDFKSASDFEILKADKCVFVKLGPKETMHVIVHVHDLLLIADDEHEMGRLKKFLSKAFFMKYLGTVRHFLELQRERNIQTGVMKMSQTHFFERLLAKFQLTECKHKSVPIEPNLNLKLSVPVKKVSQI